MHTKRSNLNKCHATLQVILMDMRPYIQTISNTAVTVKRHRANCTDQSMQKCCAVHLEAGLGHPAWHASMQHMTTGIVPLSPSPAGSDPAGPTTEQLEEQGNKDKAMHLFVIINILHSSNFKGCLFLNMQYLEHVNPMRRFYRYLHIVILQGHNT